MLRLVVQPDLSRSGLGASWSCILHLPVSQSGVPVGPKIIFIRLAETFVFAAETRHHRS